MFNTMKLYVLIGLMLISMSACKAQPPAANTGENLDAGFEVRGDSIVINNYTPGVWIKNYKAALAFAKAEQKTVLIDFTGSDWCGWCKKLDKEVFSQKEFIDYAKENLILLSLDFPRSVPQTPEEKVQNEELAKQYKIEGFPTIILLDKDGNNIGRTGYQAGGAVGYVNHLKTFIK